MVLQIPSSKTEPTVTWQSLPADYVLPDDPVENHSTTAPCRRPHRCARSQRTHSTRNAEVFAAKLRELGVKPDQLT